MLSVHLEEGLVSVAQTSRPRRRSGFALIRLRVGGICNTDIELLRGYYGFRGRPGHEFVGEVVAATDERWVGKRVVGDINLSCGRCTWCRRGLGRHCPNRTVLGIVKHPGAFAEFLTLPEENLHEVPREIPDEHAVFTEPLAAAGEILDQVSIPKGAPVAVLGDGKLGLLIAQLLAIHGAEVNQFGRHRGKLRVAETVGVHTAVERKTMPVKAFDYVIEATGSRAGLKTAVRMTRPRGTLVMKSTVADAISIDASTIVVDEITIVGSRCGRFEPAIERIREGRLNLDDMISDRFSLAEAPRAFDRAQDRNALKVLLRG